MWHRHEDILYGQEELLWRQDKTFTILFREVYARAHLEPGEDMYPEFDEDAQV